MATQPLASTTPSATRGLQGRSWLPLLVVPLAAVCVLGGSVCTAWAQSTADEDDLLEGIDDAPTAPPPTPPKAETDDEPLTAPKPKAADKTLPLRDSSKEPSAPQAEATAIDRIKAVPKKPLLKRRRLELTPMAGLSVNDSYYRHFAVSGSLAFYPHDAFGIGLGVDWLYAHLRSDNVNVIRQSQTSVLAVFELPTLFYHLDLHWAPLYGKLSVLDSFIVHFDLYTSMGFGVAKAGERYPPAMHLAIGQRFKLADWMAVRLELRDHVFLDTQQVNGQDHSDIQSYVMLVAGVSFFVPPTFEYTYR